MTICLLGKLVNPKTLHTSNEIEMNRWGGVRLRSWVRRVGRGVEQRVALQQSFGAMIL